MQNVVIALRKVITRAHPEFSNAEGPSSSSGSQAGSRRHYDDHMQQDFVAAASEFELTATALSGVVPDGKYKYGDVDTLYSTSFYSLDPCYVDHYYRYLHCR